MFIKIIFFQYDNLLVQFTNLLHTFQFVFTYRLSHVISNGRNIFVKHCCTRRVAHRKSCMLKVKTFNVIFATFSKPASSFTGFCCVYFLEITERQGIIYDQIQIIWIHFTDFTMKRNFLGLFTWIMLTIKFLILSKSAPCSFTNFVRSKLRKLRMGGHGNWEWFINKKLGIRLNIKHLLFI